MKNSKIIIVFIVIIIAMFGGYFVYKHNQKVSLAQYYYDTGDYKKASDLKVGSISDKAIMLNIAKNWRNDLGNAEDLYITIMLVYDEIEANEKTDSDYANKLGVYYKSIADYFNISKDRLDEIGKMSPSEGTLIVKNLQ